MWPVIKKNIFENRNSELSKDQDRMKFVNEIIINCYTVLTISIYDLLY